MTQYAARTAPGAHVRPRARILLGLLVGALLAGAGLVGFQVGREQGPAPVPQTAGVVAKVPSLPGFTTTYAGSGLLAVPSQIAPGTYLVAADNAAAGCGWQRQSARRKPLGGGLMARAATPQFVTVADDDGFLLIDGCSFRRAS